MRTKLSLLSITALGMLGGVSLFAAPVGDGVADDTAAIQQLVNEAGSVALPKGVYRITQTILVDLDQTGFAAVSGDGTARLVMEGAGPAIRFVGTHGGTAAPESVLPPVWERQRTPMVSGIEIVGAHAEADGIEAQGTMQLTLSRVVVRECRHAVRLVERNRNVLITECHFYHNTGIGVFLDGLNLHQINVTGSHISYNAGGGVVSRGGNVRNLHVGNCDIEGNHAAEGEPTANILLDSTGGSIGEVAITGCTIQHTHKAPDSANIRILGGGTEPRLEASQGSPKSMEGNVTITGNVMSDVQVNVHVKDARGVTISGNTFWSGFQHDLLVESSQNVVITGNNMDRNPRYIVNNTKDMEDNGVVLRDVSDSTFLGNVIRGVWHKEAAVRVDKGHRLQMAHNSILDCDGVGLWLRDVSASIIADNLIRDERPEATQTQGPSLLLEGGKDNQVGSNSLSHSSETRELSE